MKGFIQFTKRLLNTIYNYSVDNPLKVTLILFGLFATAILSNIILYGNGYQGVVSSGFLRLAENIKNGNGLYIPDYFTEQDFRYYSRNPAGYPGLIGLLSWITSIPVFWSSKLLNLILGGILMLSFYSQFKSYSWVFVSILLFATFLEVFTFSWAETGFIVSIWFFIKYLSQYRYHTRNQSINLVGVGLSILCAFLMRYVGGYLFFVIGAFLFYDLVRSRKIDFPLIASSSISGLLCLSYWFSNYVLVGKVTGRPGMENVQSFQTELLKLLEALAKELSFPVTTKFSWISIVFLIIVCQVLLVIFLVKITRQPDFHHKRGPKATSKKTPIYHVAFTAGLIYLIIICTAVFSFPLDDFGYRYLSPFVLMILIGFIDFILHNASQLVKPIGLFFVLTGFGSFLINAPVKHIYNYYLETDTYRTYFQEQRELKNKYSFISNKPTLIVCGDPKLRYLRPNVRITVPVNVAKSPKDAVPMDTFLNNMKTFPGDVYVEIKELEQNDSPHKYHPSVFDFMDEYRDSNFIQIKQ